MTRLFEVLALLCASAIFGTVAACKGEQPGETELDAGPPAAFPDDFQERYREMRDCRHSHEHELRYIRVFASPSAQASYAALSRDVPYPVGATLVKIEYDDEACSVQLQYTAMQKLGAGENRAGGDWLWQRVSLERKVLEEGAPPRCINCHSVHCAPPYGYDLSCAEEL